MADFPWEEGFKWPWEKEDKAKMPAVEVESPETSPEEQPEATPASDAARAGTPQMRASPPQMMADFPWEEGFKWPWEKEDKAKMPAVEVESPETSPEEQPEATPESTD